MNNSLQPDSSYNWTVKEIEARLGSSTILFPRDRLLQTEDIEKLQKVGITRIEVCGLGNPGHMDVDDRKYLSWVRSEGEKHGVSVVSTHSPGYLYNSDEEENRKKAVEEGVHAAKLSEERGAGVMVCHFQPEEPSEKSVNEMLDQLNGHSIKLAIENKTSHSQDCIHWRSNLVAHCGQKTPLRETGIPRFFDRKPKFFGLFIDHFF